MLMAGLVWKRIYTKTHRRMNSLRWDYTARGEEFSTHIVKSKMFLLCDLCSLWFTITAIDQGTFRSKVPKIADVMPLEMALIKKIRCF